MFLRFKTFIRRFIGKKLHLHRPTSWPYITGDSFRSLSNFVLDESLDFDPLLVRAGDIIFVRTNYLKEFSKRYQPLINTKFILISHNEDMEVTHEFVAMIDFSKCVYWFAENLQVEHKQITPIPIGLANFYSQQNGKISIFDSLTTNSIVLPSNKIKKIFWDFNVDSDRAVRERARHELSTSPLAHHEHLTDQTEYYRNLMRFSYMASPRGKGEDCNRTWEALYLGTTPVVVKTPLTLYFKEIGIPLYILNGWHEIGQQTEVELAAQAETFQQKDTAPLWMPYWAHKIHEKRKLCF